MIRLVRRGGYDRLRAYRVLLDGVEVARVGHRGEVAFDAPPGRHVLQVRIDWCGSEPVAFEHDGGPVAFECGSNLTGWKMLLAAFTVAQRPDRYLWLRRLVPPDADVRAR